MNTLYYGDNLDILKRYIKDETVDLIYLDPPFKSNQDYNVLFAEQDGTQSSAQIKAFGDTWHWDQSAAQAYQETVESGSEKVSQVMQAFHTFLGNNDMMAYLSMMAPRLVELRRVLKPTGSIYLHCDSTASHYLKLLMDAIFDAKNFQNEIIWQKIRSSKAQTKGFGNVHDIIFAYFKSEKSLFNKLYVSLSEERITKHYSLTEPDTGRKYMLDNFTQAGQGSSRKFGNRIIDPPSGKHWIWSQAKIDEGLTQGKIVFTSGDIPRVKRYLDESKGNPIEDIWSDIPPINSQAQERLGYPTQKPEALLERIIKASSNEGDVVLDPFGGCGTTIAVAQKLNRQWIGIDITHLAISLLKHRLKTTFGDTIMVKGKQVPAVEYEVIGEPKDLSGAEQLANDDKYQFQWWALGLVGARPVEQKKGADKGIDGRIYFHDVAQGKTRQIIISVKGGYTSVKDVRDLRGVLDREKAEIGVLICLQEPTQPMKTEAADAGFYSPDSKNKFAKLQILTIEDLLNGKKIEYPRYMEDLTLKKAPRVYKTDSKHQDLPFEKEE